jgi:hypothetical protein
MCKVDFKRTREKTSIMSWSDTKRGELKREKNPKKKIQISTIWKNSSEKLKTLQCPYRLFSVELRF